MSVFRTQGEAFEKAPSAVDGQWPDLPPLHDPVEVDLEPLLRAIERRARLRREQEGI